jgi:hypothetical protein
MDIRFEFSVAILVAYFIAALVGREFSEYINGSLMYAPALLVLILLGASHVATRRRERYVILGASAVFLASVTCRTIDQALCPYFPLGTHFLWHLGNGLVLYLLMRGLLANLSSGDGSSGVARESPV